MADPKCRRPWLAHGPVILLAVVTSCGSVSGTYSSSSPSKDEPLATPSSSESGISSNRSAPPSYVSWAKSTPSMAMQFSSRSNQVPRRRSWPRICLVGHILWLNGMPKARFIRKWRMNRLPPCAPLPPAIEGSPVAQEGSLVNQNSTSSAIGLWAW